MEHCQWGGYVGSLSFWTAERRYELIVVEEVIVCGGVFGDFRRYLLDDLLEGQGGSGALHLQCVLELLGL